MPKLPTENREASYSSSSSSEASWKPSLPRHGNAGKPIFEQLMVDFDGTEKFFPNILAWRRYRERIGDEAEPDSCRLTKEEATRLCFDQRRGFQARKSPGYERLLDGDLTAWYPITVDAIDTVVSRGTIGSPVGVSVCYFSLMAMTEGQQTLEKSSLSSLEKSVEDEELRALLIPNFNDLPSVPRSAVESNFVRYYAVDFLKPAHDQYIYRHANGLCVIGLAPSHAALNEVGGVQSVDFNVGKSNRSELKVKGKRKRNAQHLQPDSALCNVCADGTYYTARCCVKGSLLEVNDRLIKNPGLLNLAADREGYIAIIMPKPTDWLKVKDSFLSYEDYKKLRYQVSDSSASNVCYHLHNL